MDSVIYSALEGLVAGEVHPVRLEEGTPYPAIVYSYVGNTEEPFVDAGQLIERLRVQVDIYTKSYDQCRQLRTQALLALRELEEFMEQNVDSNGYEPDTKLFRWTLDLSFRTPQ